MKQHYLNDPNGLKPAKLKDIEVHGLETLEKECVEFLCKKLIFADPKKTFFAQNISSHIAYISQFIKQTSPQLNTLYISDHEIRWIKEMLEIPEYQPDSTHSNYRRNKPLSSATFNIKVFAFGKLKETIENLNSPAIFYVSHVSRLTGELVDILLANRLLKKLHPGSIFVVDGAQSLGALAPFDINTTCDVYLSLSSKFIGAEPHLGFAFMSDNFFSNYIKDIDSYPTFDSAAYAKDLYSLSENLKSSLYSSDYSAYIADLKKYAVKKLSLSCKDILYVPENQTHNFLTLNFGSIENNKNFVEFAKSLGVIVSDNTEWSITEPTVPLVRIGLSVRTTEKDVDKLIEVVGGYRKNRDLAVVSREAFIAEV